MQRKINMLEKLIAENMVESDVKMLLLRLQRSTTCRRWPIRTGSITKPSPSQPSSRSNNSRTAKSVTNRSSAPPTTNNPTTSPSVAPTISKNQGTTITTLIVTCSHFLDPPTTEISSSTEQSATPPPANLSKIRASSPHHRPNS